MIRHAVGAFSRVRGFPLFPEFRIPAASRFASLIKVFAGDVETAISWLNNVFTIFREGRSLGTKAKMRDLVSKQKTGGYF